MYKLVYRDGCYVETYYFKSRVALLEFVELNCLGDDDAGKLEISKE